MKIINIVLTLIFILFAAVQYNDPDPFLWGIWYIAIAIISGMAVAKKYNKLFILFCITIGVIWMGTLTPHFLEWINLGMPSIVESMKVTKPHIEYTREFLGLLISVLVLIFQYTQSQKQAV
ncbi:MAG TPA: hypothetical protein ENK52_06115 [Saprospiraceae bacterium]|nr:hypothetical protein [Saprospiraceae bacterium]